MFLPFCLQSNIGRPKKINIKYAKIHMKWELEIIRNQYIIIIHSLDIVYTDITKRVKYFALYHMQISFL